MNTYRKIPFNTYMTNLILNKNTIENEYVKIKTTNLDSIKFYTIENVVSYKFSEKNFEEWEIVHLVENNKNSIIYYFVIDQCFDDAFGHWIYESAIYLNYFLEFKKEYPTLKLLLKQRKKYKILICNFFGIEEKDIVYDTDIKYSNNTIFPTPISSLNSKSISEEYKSILQRFIKNFELYEDILPNKYICIMPRQKKENYAQNERQVDFDNIIEFCKKTGKEIYIFNTDDVKSIDNQIHQIQSAENIILSDGASFHVNGMFCKKKNIFVNGNISESQIKTYEKLKYIVEKIIGSTNKYYYCKNEEEVLSTIRNKLGL